MAEKDKTISFRVPKEDFDTLKEISEELDVDLSRLMRTYTNALIQSHEEDSLYMDVHRYLEQGRDFYDAIIEAGEIEDLLEENDSPDLNTQESNLNQEDENFNQWFLDTVRYAQREKYDEAYDMIDQIEDKGFEKESRVLDAVVEKYRD